MPLKRVPVCPICEADMAYKYKVSIPTNIGSPEAETSDFKKVQLRSPSGDTVKVVLDYEMLYTWKCSKCSFVAFFDRFLDDLEINKK